MTNPAKIIIALDYTDQKQAEAFIEQIDPRRCHLKIGKGMFTRFGPQFVERLCQRGYSLFLDLKFHDIPQQVALACQAAADLGVWMINVHAQGGRRMMTAAADALSQYTQKPHLIAVTVLTSFDTQELNETGIAGTVAAQVLRLAALAKNSGLDGVVCSAQEATQLRPLYPVDFLLVTPGIRLAGDASHDQRRVVTPQLAVKAGVDQLVIGRSITGASDPMAVLAQIEGMLM